MATIHGKKSDAVDYNPQLHQLHIGNMTTKSYDGSTVIAYIKGSNAECCWVKLKKFEFYKDELLDISWVEQTTKEALEGCSVTPVGIMTVHGLKTWNDTKSETQRKKRRVLRKVSKQMRKLRKNPRYKDQKSLTILLPKRLV